MSLLTVNVAAVYRGLSAAKVRSRHAYRCRRWMGRRTALNWPRDVDSGHFDVQVIAVSDTAWPRIGPGEPAAAIACRLIAVGDSRTSRTLDGAGDLGLGPA